ncbi:MAG: cyclic nucleotide-binding domain-containing protein [Myxococcales bacterium]|nr:cyclic nucleotide-binding domain-containing protein [Myxococcales bacterium]
MSTRLHPDTMREALKRVPFLSTFDAATLDAVGSMLGARRLEEGQSLYREGEPGDSMMIVVSGRLAVKVRSRSSPRATSAVMAATDEVDVAAVYPGEVVGEMACVDPGPRSASVVATKTSQVLELSRTTLRTFIDHAPKVAVAVVGAVIGLLARRVRDTNGRIETEMGRRGIATGSRMSTALPPLSGVGQDDGRVDLRQVACLKGFSNAELEALVKVAPPKSYADGTVLCREGEPGDSCFIVAKGVVTIVRSVGGMERVMAVLEGGSLVGQMALVDRSPRSATVRVRGEAVVLTLHQRAFDQLLSNVHPFAVKFQEQIAVAGTRQLRLANQRFAGLIERPPVTGTHPAVSVAEAPSVSRPAAASPLGPKAGPPPARGPLPPRDPTLEGRPRSEDERMADMLTYMQTALGEWNLSLEDIEDVTFETPDAMRGARPRP